MPRKRRAGSFSRSNGVFLSRLEIVEERVPSFDHWPFELPFVRDLDLKFRSPVTFFVGENGSGKSTLMEAVAQICGLPVSGGGKNELAAMGEMGERSPLAPALRVTYQHRPADGFFFRAEFMAHFATLLDDRRADPDFGADPYSRYGGESLHRRSHGEAFLSIFQHRLESGIYLMDEPESALSPQRQLSLLVQIDELAKTGAAQFIIATHSPILLTFPGATIYSFDDGALREITFRDTSHYQITRRALEAPEKLWQYLRGDLEGEG